ncbi:MAG: AAA family ATPase [Gammaproteobacteria bacterium]|nr:AAA family ATPase [Gammaproteobacteria bacterium]
MVSEAKLAFLRQTPDSLDIPAEFADVYSDEDKRHVVRIIEWLNASQLAEHERERWSQARLAKAAGLNQGTLNQLIRGRYPSAPAAHLGRLLSTIERQETRRELAIVPVPIVATTVHKRVAAICRRAHHYRSFGVVAGEVGVGKTCALRAYASSTAGVYYVRALHAMTISVLLDELVEVTAAPVYKSAGSRRGTQAERLAAVRRRLTGQDALLILDEANRVNAGTLETLRDLRDLAGVGVVLAGTPVLYHMLRDVHGRFGQISSRIIFWPPTMNAITEGDAHTITRAAFEAFGHEEPSATILDACWQACEGSARVLAENLLPALRDYVLRKGIALSPEVVFQAAEEILGYSRRGRTEARS